MKASRVYRRSDNIGDVRMRRLAKLEVFATARPPLFTTHFRQRLLRETLGGKSDAQVR